MVNSATTDDDVQGDADTTVDTRERLVRAAIEVFLEKGYGGTRVQDIARRAGFTSGALYVHFPSRTALLGEAIIREGNTILTSMVEQVEQVEVGQGRISRLLATFSTAEASDLDRLLLEALALASRDAEARQRLGGSLDAFVAAVERHIVDGQESGLLDASLDRDALVFVVLSWVFGAVMTKALDLVQVSAEQLEEVNSRLLTTLVAGA